MNLLFLFTILQLFATPSTVAQPAPLSSTISLGCSNSCPLSQWCYLNHLLLSCPFSFCSQSFPESGSFPMTRLFASSGKNIAASTSASVLPVSIWGWFLLGLTGLISFQYKGLLRVFSSTIVQKHQFFGAQPSSVLSLHQFSHPYMTTGKTVALTRQILVGKVMSLLFNMMSRLVIAFLTRSKHLLISWLQSTSTVTLEPKKIKSVTSSTFSPSICINPSVNSIQFSSVQSLSCVLLYDPMDCSLPDSMSLTNSQSLLKLMSTESVMASNHLIFCHPLLLPPSIFPRIRVFSNESVLPVS